MPALINAVQVFARATLHQSAERAVTATVSSASLDISDYEGQIAITEVLTSATGVTTCITTIESSDDTSFGGGANPTVVHATFATYTSSDLKRVAYKIVDTNACHRFLRATLTISATSAISAAIVLTGMKKVQ